MASMRQSCLQEVTITIQCLFQIVLLLMLYYSHEKDYLFFIQMGITKHCILMQQENFFRSMEIMHFWVNLMIHIFLIYFVSINYLLEDNKSANGVIMILLRMNDKIGGRQMMHQAQPLFLFC